MNRNHPKRHHYVPQFYLRQFSSAKDKNKVPILERHRDIIAVDYKSIDRIGYEESLHDYIVEGNLVSIEGAINRFIETPFSESPTWRKISSGNCAQLNTEDRLPIYGFAWHLFRRNLEMLSFIKTHHARFKAGLLDEELTEDERNLHEWIATSTDGAHALFREGALDTMLPEDASKIGVMVCRSPIPLRSSTNPMLPMSHPGDKSPFGPFFENLRTWWLALDRYWGALIVAGGPPGFNKSLIPEDAARMLNRLYLVQFLNSLSVRYLIAEDANLSDDLKWAGYRFERKTTHGSRWKKRGI